MKELLRSTDPTQIAFAEALLSGEGIAAFVLDVHTSILEGSIGILPRRILARPAAKCCTGWAPRPVRRRPRRG